MKTKKELRKVRGWFPKEPMIPKSSAKIDYQPLQREPWISRNKSILGLIGGVLSVLIALGTIFVGLIFSDTLRNYNIYATGEQNPQLIATVDLVLGGVGLAAGIIGIIGSRIGKQRGSILLIIAGAMEFLLFFFGVLPAILMLISGASELGKNRWNLQKHPENWLYSLLY